ncbi:hypothetical protein A20C1_03891 [marine actinobacterium PHSC20C1]|nr:hypothetical protein A20C1_03891 [marine actinobacterium PHSC20C1]
MTDTAAPALTPEAKLALFRSRRDQTVVQQNGNLALTNTQWVDAEQTIWGVPGTWTPHETGLAVTATAEDNIVVDGRLVEGTVVVRSKSDNNPSSIVFGETVTGFVIQAPEGNHALRVWDTNSPAIQEFGTIDAYPYNPDWVITAAFTPNPEGTTLGFEHLKDNGQEREQPIPGDISFTKDGVDYSLAAFKAGRALQLVFADATSGVDTYSVGRFLFIAPNPDGTIVLDFNLAILPPCAFSYNFNCPMPPKQNRFSVAIEAGEKNVLKKDGSLLHE